MAKEPDYARVFAEQNPWFSGGGVPDALAPGVERPLASRLWLRLKNNIPRRFQLILGARRVGKTTAMYQTVRRLLSQGMEPGKLWWLRLDHPLLMQFDLGRLVKSVMNQSSAAPSKPAYLFLDEVTYATDWDLWLKTLYDERWPVRLAATSSSTAALRHRRLESGVGRWEEQYLAPYLFGEFLELVGHPQPIPTGASLADTIALCLKNHVSSPGLSGHRSRYLLMGGFPELLMRDRERTMDEKSLFLDSQRTLRSDAVERAIYKDIPQAFGVDNPLLLERMLYTLAGQVAGILSPTTLGQTLRGMTQPTFDKYLAYLERAFLVFTLQNYSGHESARQKRGRKLYFVDGAVRNAALQRGLTPLDDPSEMGLLMENMLASHLHTLARQSHVRTYYWREKKLEIDLIYDHPESPLAFEIASSPRHEVRNLWTFMNRFPRFRNRCFLVAPGLSPGPPEGMQVMPPGIGTLPTDLLLLAISAQAERETAQSLTGGA